MEPTTNKGHLHPLSQMIAEINSIFAEIGFVFAEGPELELVKYNFDKLNVPQNHPARDMQDTFYIDGFEDVVMRTHTSPVQVRYMEAHPPAEGSPIRMICPGKVFRNETTDATHEAQFYQLEGLMIDRNVSIGHLKGTLEYFFKRFFGGSVEVRVRPSFFPFVEPGLEVDMRLTGEDAPVKLKDRWIEMMGAGMVHPHVLRGAGIDPTVYQGFAFGMGADRLAVIKYGIDDVRLLYSGDLRVVSQFYSLRMKISYNWLSKKYFDGKLPPVAEVERALTFHAWEVEEVVAKGGDALIDVKVLPDKTAWALSHRGIAKDIGTVLQMPLMYDPLRDIPILPPGASPFSVTIDTSTCDRYIGAYVKDVRVGESPEWLKDLLATIGQRSINNIVDATNYVMFNVGQPLHAFDASKLRGTKIGVRTAREGEVIVSLTGESYTLTENDAVIVDGVSDELLGIAGVKGGKVAEVDDETTDLFIEAAHFDRVAVRHTSGRLRLRTDASVRYENGIVSDLTAYGIRDVVALILEIAGGELVGYTDTGRVSGAPEPVALTLAKVNSVLGISLTKETLSALLDRFQYPYTWSGGDVVTVTPPFERTDIIIPEDLIEEIGRIYGYEHVLSVVPEPVPLARINKTFYYTDRIRRALTGVGFSEVYTSSFRAEDDVKLKNAFAADKGYLRSTLTLNMNETLLKNAPYVDLLQVKEVRIFEIGTVFARVDGVLVQTLQITLGVRGASGYKAKLHESILALGVKTVEESLGTTLVWKTTEGVTEASLTSAYEALPTPTSYSTLEQITDVTYKTFSQYPFVSRDIALWCDESVTAEDIETLIREEAGTLLLHSTRFDEFHKDGKVSYAFRLVFQSFDKTLTDTEVGDVMQKITTTLTNKGYSVR